MERFMVKTRDRLSLRNGCIFKLEHIFFSQDSILLGVELLKHLGYDREVRKTLAF
jgi:hypothetical protein